jgi:hypothetical protein
VSKSKKMSFMPDSVASAGLALTGVSAGAAGRVTGTSGVLGATGLVEEELGTKLDGGGDRGGRRSPSDFENK